ncbi:hypothetical protein [Nitrosospira sp. Nsp11]|uniref:hypothetical protein n=1 Tax=Nitrosospira sp. Nsp11 TaxID=1855338 RepID=UPI0015B74D04|nr:hypothetical protein [Nitrosospira sp. Nsp11]
MQRSGRGRINALASLPTEWILENPGTFIGMMPKKFFRFWGMDGEGEWGYQAGTT